MKYYLERRDPDFEAKMREILLVYQEVALQNQRQSPGGPSPLVVTEPCIVRPAERWSGMSP